MQVYHGNTVYSDQGGLPTIFARRVDFVYVLIPISGVLITYYIHIKLCFWGLLQYFGMLYSVLRKLASAVLTLIYKTKYDLMIALL